MTAQATAPRQSVRAGAQSGDPYFRQPAVAGRFYPANGATLAGEVKRLLAGGTPPRLRRVRALVAPHAGYACSGEVAAAAYRALAASMPPAQPGTEAGPQPTVYLLGPAHWKAVHGVGLSGAAVFATPLGQVPVAIDRLHQLAALGGQYRVDDAAHAPEHCLEVHLPFLQTVLAAPRIAPLLLDDGAAPEQLAGDLCTLLEDSPDDLVVVSSDLSHYHPYQEAIILDHGFLKALATHDMAAVNASEACGLLPVLCLMHVAQHFGWQPHLLAYANSGDTCGSRREVVGYGAIVYTE
ncbi:MAG: AmmeMemoRadiSam system protein B [Caldilineaceae bacterium]